MTVRLMAVAVLVAFLLGIGVATFSETRIFMPALLWGAVVTLQVAGFSFLLMVAAAWVAGAAKASSFPPVRWMAGAYIEIFRGTWLLVQLFWFYFVMPEFGVSLPALGNYFIGLFKETPLLSFLVVAELMHASKLIGSEYYRFTEAVTVAGVFFLVMSLAAAALVRFAGAYIRGRILH